MAEAAEPSIDTVTSWIFDLDNTLYSADSGIGTQVSERMTDFLVEMFEINRDDAFALRRSLFLSHGTTLRGLMTEHGIDPHYYLAYVHDLDLTELGPDPALSAALAALPGRRFVHTNASAAHAERVLAALGLSHHFEGIIDIIASDYLPKPDFCGYRRLAATYGVEPTNALMVEDIARNLRPAAELGMATLWVHTENDWAQAGSNDPWVHHKTRDLAAWLRDCRHSASSVDTKG